MTIYVVKTLSEEPPNKLHTTSTEQKGHVPLDPHTPRPTIFDRHTHNGTYFRGIGLLQ